MNFNPESGTREIDLSFTIYPKCSSCDGRGAIFTLHGAHMCCICLGEGEAPPIKLKELQLEEVQGETK